jgi:hypothetical protein
MKEIKINNIDFILNNSGELPQQGGITQKFAKLTE